MLLTFIAGFLIGSFVAFFVYAALFIDGFDLFYNWRNKFKEYRFNKTPKCPMRELPDVESNPLGARITAWATAADSGTYREWYPARYEDDAWNRNFGPYSEFRLRIDESLGVASEIERIDDCYEELSRMYKAGVYTDGCRYLASLYYYASIQIKELLEKATQLQVLRKAVDDETLKAKLDDALDKIPKTIQGIISRYFEDELAELIRLAAIKELRTWGETVDALPEVSVSTTTPEEIAKLKAAIDDILAVKR